MKTLSPDTHPDIERLLIEGYRKMTPAEKFRRVIEMNRFAYHLMLAEVRARYPSANQQEWDLRVASRSLPADLMLRAFGWDVDEKGY